WADDLYESGALCSTIHWVAHPELYLAGCKTLMRTSATTPLVRQALDTWPTVFPAVHVISNCETPFHQDTSGQAAWFEMLTSFGTYSRATLVARNIGIQMAYKPGSAILLSSLLIHHG
ncbi:hypothetical protein C8Q74DRAFT_1157040, partial [Fomes fomentarius]